MKDQSNVFTQQGKGYFHPGILYPAKLIHGVKLLYLQKYTVSKFHLQFTLSQQATIEHIAQK